MPKDGFVNCKQCEAQMSKYAWACPRCGHVTRNIRIMLVIVAGAYFLGIIN